jgi:nucleoside-diphosphate-sugar epimerase
MKLFITGATGFLGKHVLRVLKNEGHEIRALSRSEQSDKIIQQAGAVPVRGDLQSSMDLTTALNAIETVIHCAAPVEFWGPWSKFEDGIVNATQKLFEAAVAAGVRRFIFISSESVLQKDLPLQGIDESFPYPPEPNSYYGKAKKQAEEFLLNSAAPIDIIILRPPFIWGPQCPAIETIKQKVATNEFIWVEHGKSAFEAVHVENVVEAIRLALTQGKNKGVYFITDDEPSTVRTFFQPLFEQLKLKVPTRSMPGPVARLAARISEFIWRNLNLKSNPPLTLFDLAFVSMPRQYLIKKASVELNYQPVISRKLALSQL